MGFFGRDKDREPIPGARPGIKDMLAMAKQLQAASAGASGAQVGSTDWLRQLSGILAGPEPGYVKRCTCNVCGAPKKLPSITAYVYCDYCGSLIDFDLHRACEMSTPPGPEYAALVNGLQAQLRAARSSGDRDQYRALQRQIFSSYVTNCPNAVSHRAKADQAYCDQFIAYMAESMVVPAFDPEATRLEEEMTQRVVRLQWSGSFTDRQVSAEGFWAMTETLARQIDVSSTLLRDAGVNTLDPDKGDHLTAKLAWSGFCQGWLRYLSPEVAEKLLHTHGLINQYVAVSPEHSEPRSCIGCGGKVHALPGAKVVVCDTCGRRLDVGSAALVCPGCGGSMTFPVGGSNASCPFCQTNLERVGV